VRVGSRRAAAGPDLEVEVGSSIGAARYLGEPFEAFYRREFMQVVALAFALSGSRAAAEDLAQDGFVVASRRWDTVGRYERPEAFVRRVVANAAVSRHRRLAAETRALSRLAAKSRQPLGALEPADIQFWDAVRRLGGRQAQVVALYFLEDRPVDDIAEILDCAPSTVRVHLHRGLSTLAKRFGVREDMDP
jgi:RNA polymerase sigma factor (sigma-70 family)